jgi:protein-tyrosine-phosphatase
VADEDTTRVEAPSILFVCTANICRSPMAAALFRTRLKAVRPDWEQWKIESAGTWGLDGQPAAKNSRVVMAEKGLDITGHRARTVTSEMLEQYDLILTMEPGHKEALRIEFPSVASRVFMLSEMEGVQVPVRDPYGGPITAFHETVERLDEMIERGMARILALVCSRHE